MTGPETCKMDGWFTRQQDSSSVKEYLISLPPSSWATWKIISFAITSLYMIICVLFVYPEALSDCSQVFNKFHSTYEITCKFLLPVKTSNGISIYIFNIISHYAKITYFTLLCVPNICISHVQCIYIFYCDASSPQNFTFYLCSHCQA